MRDRARPELTPAARRRRWLALGLYVVTIYAVLPYGPRVGLGLLGTRFGSWLLGPGLLVAVGIGGIALVRRLRRRHAPVWAYAAVATAAVGYTLAFSWLRAARLERTHLPEYGVAAFLAWRALAPGLTSLPASYVAAAALAAAIGYCDELLQAVVPGRHYDLRDVAMNVLGAVLGVVVLAAARAGASGAASRDRRSDRPDDAPVTRDRLLTP